MIDNQSLVGTPRCADIINAIEDRFPLSNQESWDNSGLQVGDPAAPCTGVLLCVDVTEQVIDEAIARGCNMIVAHHPLIFKGLKNITGANHVQRCVIKAIASGIAVYASHTPLDKTPGGISDAMAARLGATITGTLDPATDCTGTDRPAALGAVAPIAPVEADALVEVVKNAFTRHPLLCSAARPASIHTIAFCGGSGGEFIPAAIARGAQAYITADVRYHDFVDYGRDIFILDVGHFESESCAKDIFYAIITQKFCNFAVYYSESENNPINYL